MKIRKFTAPSVPLALQQVRDALGDRAVILNTRKLPAGGDPESRVEITAALDETAPVPTSRPPAAVEAGVRERRRRPAAVAAGGRRDLLGRVYGRSRPADGGELEADAAPRPRWQEGEPEVKERHIRSAAEWLAGLPSVARGGAAGPVPPARAPRPFDEEPDEPRAGRSLGAEPMEAGIPATGTAPFRGTAAPAGAESASVSDALVVSQLRQLEEAVHRMARHTGGFELPPELARLGERLRRTGLSEAHIHGCLQALLRELDDDAVADPAAVSAAAARRLGAMLPERRDLRIGKGRKVVALVGASGTGKTTAAARIAAGFARRQSRRAAQTPAEPIVLVSADTRRVGALAQAQAFAELIGVPLATAYDADDMQAAVEAHPQARLLLVDTGGCGPHEREPLDAQRRLLAAAGVDEVHVVVDGLTGYDHIVETAGAWKDAGQVRLLVTKMDQGVRPGAVVSAAIDSGLPLSYLTVSAGVPGGIRPGDLTPWVEWMVGLAPRPFAGEDA